MGVLANASEDVEHFATVRFGVLHPVRRDQRQSIRAGKIDKLPIGLFLAANEMPLNFDKHIFATENVDQKSRAILRILGSAGALACTVRRLAERREISGGGAGNKPRGGWAPQSKQRDQTLPELWQLVPFDRAFAFF